MVIRISKDLTQVVYLVKGDREEPLSYVPDGFEPFMEVKIPGEGPSWLREGRVKEIYLHPTLGGLKLKDLLGGDAGARAHL